MTQRIIRFRVSLRTWFLIVSLGCAIAVLFWPPVYERNVLRGLDARVESVVFGAHRFWKPYPLREVTTLHLVNPSNDDLACVCRLRHLRSLSLEGGSWDVDSLKMVGRAQSLTNLIVYNIRLNGEVLDALADLPNRIRVNITVDRQHGDGVALDANALPAFRHLVDKHALYFDVAAMLPTEMSNYRRKLLGLNPRPSAAIAKEAYSAQQQNGSTGPQQVPSILKTTQRRSPGAGKHGSGEETGGATSLAVKTDTSAAVSSNGNTLPPHEREQAHSRFVNHGKFVEDRQTGLLWQRDGDEAGLMDFYEAAAYAKSLNLGTVRGWRLPTADELKTIFPADKPPFINSGYHASIGPETPVKCYWTADTLLPEKPMARVVPWYADGPRAFGRCDGNENSVRCVHDPITDLSPAPMTSSRVVE